MSIFGKFFGLIYWQVEDDLKQIDAQLPDGTPVRVMESCEGFHVAVGKIYEEVPEAVSADEVMPEIFRQWLGGV